MDVQAVDPPATKLRQVFDFVLSSRSSAEVARERDRRESVPGILDGLLLWGSV